MVQRDNRSEVRFGERTNAGTRVPSGTRGCFAGEPATAAGRLTFLAQLEWLIESARRPEQSEISNNTGIEHAGTHR